MIPVGRLAPAGQWDQTMLDDLLAGFQRFDGYPVRVDGCCLIVPGRYWAGHEAEISAAIARFTWVLLFVTSDEESLFDLSKVVHPNLKAWVQTPRHDYGDARLFGVGYSPHAKTLPPEPPEKLIPVFLSGQRTHRRREECFAALKGVEGRVHPTEGFTQGMDPAEYVRCMSKAKIAPAPSGAVSPDSFRLWEALEAHAIPIADTVSPVDGPTDYWLRLFPDAPFPIIADYGNLPGWVEDLLAGWPANANRITAWWMRQKRRYKQWLYEDLEALGAL